MQKIMFMVGSGLVGVATSPIFSTDWFIGISGCAILIMAAFIDR